MTGLTTLAFTDLDRRLANVSPAEQRARRLARLDRFKAAAARLEPPAPVVEAPPPAAIAPEAMPAETDPPPVTTSAADPVPVLAYPPVARIQNEVAAYFGVTVLDLKSHRRTRDVVRPRQIAMYLCRHLTPHSLPMIGRHFGGRDHTTGLHAVNKISALMRSDWLVAFQVAHLFNVITGEWQ